jgi:hypothetical protein
VDRLQAMCNAKRILQILAMDRFLTAAARAEALTLSGSHPTPEVVELIADNPSLCFARWRRCLLRTHALISILAAFRQGSDITGVLLIRVAQDYPAPREIALMCNPRGGFASRLLKDRLPARHRPSGSGHAIKRTVSGHLPGSDQ